MSQELKVGDKVKVIANGRTGIVEKIFSHEDYPIQVNFGYGDSYTFKPHELEKISQPKEIESKS